MTGVQTCALPIWFKTPFVCGARNLGEALRRIGEGATMVRTKGEAGSGIFKSSDPAARAKAIVQAAQNFDNPGKLLEASRSLGEAMPGLDISKIPEGELLQTRGW